ncbi:alkene reductase [Nocardia pseudobrasiliensis]|uniref:N-ethylmaleimide reductase n=1 Tax=Nocardia pseudobrasiliensis TaxID=45979 RepID=A0A370ICE3_9NOCA|nr:alkene reductase [Nocardia pseudobrasiliensis]RDI68399.1 N-ethylmaleimide reductase [Nocardia pseudobrasiliensis]
MDVSPILWSPLRLGAISLNNRLVMAPMTRCRSNADGVPSDMNAEFYAQHASMGLIIAESTQICDRGRGYENAPGCYTQAHVEGWRKVVDAVHAHGGRMTIQLYHCGRMTHPDLIGGQRPVAPSAVAPDLTVHTSGSVAKPAPVPHALTLDEIAAVIEDFRVAASYAIAAGADGVEVHAANGYLLHQFLADNTNLRADRYGGPVENRIRLVLEVTRAVVDEIGAERTGIRISPGTSKRTAIVENDTRGLYGALVTALAPLDLAYLHLMFAGPDESLLHSVRTAWPHGFVLNRVNADLASRLRDVADTAADATALARMALANPDLVERIKKGAQLNEPDTRTFYSGGAHGYLDYPLLSDSPYQPSA